VEVDESLGILLAPRDQQMGAQAIQGIEPLPGYDFARGSLDRLRRTPPGPAGKSQRSITPPSEQIIGTLAPQAGNVEQFQESPAVASVPWA